MAVYSVSVSNTALSTTNDTMTFIAAASRRARVLEVIVGGMGTTSAANEVRVARSTGGTTGGGAITPAKLDASDAPTAATVVDTTWSAQPTIDTVPLLRLPVNANGGIIRWVARPGEEIEIRNSEQLSIRSATGTSNVSVTVVFEEK